MKTEIIPLQDDNTIPQNAFYFTKIVDIINMPINKTIDVIGVA